MANAVKGLFRGRWQPQLIFVRNRNKINITKPRPPHFDRALMEHICKPYFFKEKKTTHVPNYNLCQPNKNLEDDLNPLEILLLKESLNWFQNSKLLAFCHLNQLNPEENFQYQLLFKKNGMKFLVFNKDVLRKAVSGTIYESVLILFKSSTAVVVCPNPAIYKLLNIIKKMPKLVLMAAVVENKFLSHSELEHYGKLQSIEEARVQLLGIINETLQKLVQQINYHPNNIVQLLVKIQKH